MPVYFDDHSRTHYNYQDDSEIVLSYTLKYTLAYRGVRSMSQPYILYIYWYPESGLRRRTASHSTLLLSGGRGDKALAVFDASSPIHGFLLSVCKTASEEVSFVMPLVDLLQEQNHWFAPLLSKWRELAEVPFKPERKSVKKPKPSIYDD